MTHPVLAALRERPPGARIALVVEGGGMRGAVSGGMALALDELGLSGAFDAAYGSSAGTLNAMWLVSGRLRDGIPTWIDPDLVGALIDKRRALRGGPVVDVRTLVEERYEQLSPGLFDAVLGSGTELHPIATDAASGEAVDLHDHIEDPRTLRLALRASAALPLLAGPPVALDGRRLVDAGLSAAIPFRAALAGGATHVLVLRSRRAGETVTMQSGQEFKFHFSPSENGYLYIIGPGNKNVPTTFLTAAPVGGLTTNEVKSGLDFVFPVDSDGKARWIQLDSAAGTDEFNIIFSTTPLTAPDFLSQEAGHELTAGDQKQLSDMREQSKANAVSTEVIKTGASPSVSVKIPQNAEGKPVIFTVRIEHK